MSAVVLIIGLAILSASLSQLGSCDIDLDVGPGEGTHSKHLKVGVSKTTDLVDGEAVTILSSAFDKRDAIAVTQCLATASAKHKGIRACDTDHGQRFAITGPAFAARVAIHRLITIDHRAYDCAARPKRCLLVAADGADFDQSGGQPLTFRSGLPPVDLVPAPDRPASDHLPVTGKPEAPVRAGAPLTLRATGLQPDEPIIVAWCTRRFEKVGPVDGDFGGTDNPCQPASAGFAISAIAYSDLSDPPVRADAHGTVAVTIAARRTIQPFTFGLDALSATDWKRYEPTRTKVGAVTIPTRFRKTWNLVSCPKVGCEIVIAAAADPRRSAVVQYDTLPG